MPAALRGGRRLQPRREPGEGAPEQARILQRARRHQRALDRRDGLLGEIAGGGLGLMLTADYIVAGESARFVSKYANIGLTPDLSVSTLLPSAIGQTRALRMLLDDLTIDAVTAVDWGLVTEVAADPAARGEEIARSWLAGATAAFGQAKRLVRAGARRSFADNLDDEAQTIGAAFDTPDARARVAAFAAASVRSSARPDARPAAPKETS